MVIKQQISLKKILDQIPLKSSPLDTDVKITGIVADSRNVKSGDLFIAISGEVTDGHRFITDAIARGAVAVIGMQEIDDIDVPYVRVEDSRRALAHVAAAYFDFPAKNLTMIGVTGTDGKTTTINLIFNILQAAGIKTGMISTVNAVIGTQMLDTGFHVTTPDAQDVQRYLANMVESGLTHVLLETTSHGLEQYRVEACEFNIGVVTNITHEHLDYHGTFEKYRASKSRLFQYLASSRNKPGLDIRAAVLNRDDSSYSYLKSKVDVQEVSYGLHPEADVRAENILYTKGELSFDVIVNKERHRLTSKLIGKYNVSNCLAAITSSVEVLGIDMAHAESAINTFETVPGRMETIDLGQDFIAIVDFAHTPNALKNSLEAARVLTRGNIIAVFGSAGLRDRSKRWMMAEISLQLANLTCLTAEDPRTESIDVILQEMAEGAIASGGQEGRNFWRIPDRGEAIRYAIRLAKSGDLVIVCGKGHEQSMCFGDIEYAWDDRTALRAALSEYLSVPGPTMPYLPTQD